MSPTPTTGLLAGRRILITGVVTTDSIAFATARAALDAGAEIVLSGLPRDLDRTGEAAEELPGAIAVVGADLTVPADVEALRGDLAERWGRLDGALHAVAFAPRGALAGDLLATEFDDVSRAMDASTYSYAALARVLRDLAPETGGSLVGLDFDAAGAWPVYNWMGVCKAGLEAVSRYVARDLGPRRIRSNLVAAGPLHTRAAGGIADFEALTDAWAAGSPIAWDDKDSAPVADAVVFLLSDLARMITGEILHVDGGYHAMAAPPHRGPTAT
ncbi:MAG: enoyl-ACP reductase FabI [Acidimicrobiales bacterium]|mgnify:CR=1 FL=1|nr:enoyl-ACP reductase FabI [Acidimicrobiales bacterium]HRW38606.1 enoyl-ACP reductase FabI [Aquihabitans sp.]